MHGQYQLPDAKWLASRRPEAILCVALRAALRVFPLFERVARKGQDSPYSSHAIELRRRLSQIEKGLPIPESSHGVGRGGLGHLYSVQSLIPMTGGNEGGTAMLNAARAASPAACKVIEAYLSQWHSEELAQHSMDCFSFAQDAFQFAQMEADIVTYEIHLNMGCPWQYGTDATNVLQIWRDVVAVGAVDEARLPNALGPLWTLPLPGWWPADAIRGKFHENQLLCAISYHASADEEPLADRIYNDLTRSGFQCWKWNRQPRIGVAMIDSYQQALSLGAVVLFVASAHAIKRPAVLQELQLALDFEEKEVPGGEITHRDNSGSRPATSPIIHCVRIDDAVLQWDHPIGERLRRTYVHDLSDWKISGGQYDSGIEIIMDNLRESWFDRRLLRQFMASAPSIESDPGRRRWPWRRR